MTRKTARVAIVGMGGFAGAHHKAMQILEESGDCQLVAACDPKAETFTEAREIWKLEARSVHIYTDYLAMLDAHRDEIDFVTLPTPIPLHAQMHRACVERQLGCYLEKPPTLSWFELDAMIATDAGAKRATQVGFNFIVEEPRRALKKRLLAGEFGKLRRAGFLGHWPRAVNYFRRAPWAGKLMLDNQLVLDSCTGNAMAHYIQNVLFWCGQDEVLSWGDVHEVETELLRAHHIESFDTCFTRGLCGDGVELRISATHAGAGRSWHREWIECDKATITYRTGSHYDIAWHDGRREEAPADRRNLLVENLRYYARYLNGEEPRPLIRLEDSRPFVHFNNLLFIASNGITTVDKHYIVRTSASPDSQWVAIEGIETVMEQFAKDGLLPSESGLPWGHSGGRAGASDVTKLELIIRQMHAVSE